MWVVVVVRPAWKPGSAGRGKGSRLAPRRLFLLIPSSP